MLESLLNAYRTRRSFLGLLGGLISFWLPPAFAFAAQPAAAPSERAKTAAAHRLLARVLPQHAEQIHLTLLPSSDAEYFRITGAPGKIRISGTTQSAMLMGVNWYLKYVAGVSVSWNGNCLNRLPAVLPAPSSPVRQDANVLHRFALNDTNDGYTGPYWSWAQWEQMIDVLALHGINEMLVYMGAEAVYLQTFQQFGYTREELLTWFPTPAHQPWWLLDNMSGWVGPSLSQHLLDERLSVAQKMTNRLRELGMSPVLPGYYGMVPDAFEARNHGARTIAQGDWLGMKRPDWLDPTCEAFHKVAAAYYRAQEQLLGPASLYKMDPLHEGGHSGTVNIREAAQSISDCLQQAHPGAIWAILGWQKNPRKEVLAGVKNKQHVLILDGLCDRYPTAETEAQWGENPYAFGSIWNFGGHTTMGANIGVWHQRYFDQLAMPNRTLNGIAAMPEASCNNPVAFAFLTEIAWHAQRPDLAQWFRDWSSYRYGGRDAHAAEAWEVLGTTAYDTKSSNWSEPHDNLFSAQPSLTASSACAFSPKEPRYSLDAFADAIPSLLAVDPTLRESSAYRYDLVDVGRQTLANHSRVLLPKIDAAYQAKDGKAFRALTDEWLRQMDTLNRVVATEPALLVGAWFASAELAANSAEEAAQLHFDAGSLLLEWGPPSSRTTGVHDYANREWDGLLEFYRQRWSMYFAMLTSVLEGQGDVREIDWFAVDQDWSRQRKAYPAQPRGRFYEEVQEAIAGLPPRAVSRTWPRHDA